MTEQEKINLGLFCKVLDVRTNQESIVVYTDEEIAEIIANDPTQQSNNIRKTRDALLLACDWTQLADVPAETKQKWVSYRQALRDITLQPGFPSNVTFPLIPE